MTLKNFDILMEHPKEDHKMKYVENLAAIGAATELCEFLADVLQCESDMMHITGKYLVEINNQLANHLKIDDLVSILQKIFKSILAWKERIDDLDERKADLPKNMDIDKSKLGQVHSFKAICSLETSKTSLKEGEDVEITDSSSPGFIKVRNADGREGYLPLLSCFLPSPDLNIDNCVERLRIQLLTCSSDLVVKLQSSLTKNLSVAVKEFVAHLDRTFVLQTSRSSVEKFKEKSRSILEGFEDGKLQLKHLARSLRNLENEFIRSSLEDTEDVRNRIANMDKAILLFLAFADKLLAYRAEMKTTCRPIRMARLDADTLNLHKNKNLRYYEVRLTANETTIREERTYFPPKSDTSKENIAKKSPSNASIRSGSSKQCSVQSVVDPRSGEELSIKEAVCLGILDHRSSQYVNLETGEKIPMSAAIAKGLIKISRRTVPSGDEFNGNANNNSSSSSPCNMSKNDDKSTNFNDNNNNSSRPSSFLPSEGLVTLRTKVMKSEYEIAYALDRASGNRVGAAEADDLGIVKDGLFHDTEDGHTTSFDEAIRLGWLGVTGRKQSSVDDDVDKLFDEREQTFAVESVYDPSTGSHINFLDAVKRHLIDPATGCLSDGVTKKKIFAREAIERGLIKARPIETRSDVLAYELSARRYLRQTESSVGFHQ